MTDVSGEKVQCNAAQSVYIDEGQSKVLPTFQVEENFLRQKTLCQHFPLSASISVSFPFLKRKYECLNMGRGGGKVAIN